MGTDNITSIKSSVMYPFDPVFIMLLAEIYPEIFPKCKKYFFISESLSLN